MIKFLVLNLSLCLFNLPAYAEDDTGVQSYKDCDVFDVTTQFSELGTCKNMIIESYEAYGKGAVKVPKKLYKKSEALDASACIELNEQYSICDAPAKKEPVFFDCPKALMSEPSCIDRLNATRVCKGKNTEEFATMIQDCVKKYKEMMGDKANAIAMCAGGYSSSSKKEDKETFCNGNKSKPEAINDSKMPKVLNGSDFGVKKAPNTMAK